MESKPKIFRIFSNDHHLDNDLSKYDLVFPNIDKFLKKLWLAYCSTPIDDFTDEEFDDLNQEIIKTIKENPDIQGVYMGYDIEAFLITAIFNSLNMPSIKLPDLESFYQVHHKVYQKMLEESPTNYSYFDLFADDWDKQIPKFPFYMKSALGDGGLHNYIVRDKNQLDCLIQVLRSELPKQERIYLYFAKKYLDLTKFPFADKHIILCEELIENFTNLNMDAIVDHEGNIQTLLFSDQLIKKEIVLGYRFPSQMSEDVTQKAKSMGLDLIQKSGLRNASFNIEYFILGNGDIKIMEVNARSSLYFNFNYHIYGIRYLDLAVHLSMGKKINLPRLEYPLKFSTQLHILTKENGKINDILDINKCFELDKLEDYVVNFETKEIDVEHIIEDNYHKNGYLFLQIFFASLTREENEKEILKIQNLLLLKDTYFK